MRTVKEISELTGISVRTLHYYDEIGLLKPTQKSDAGYRLYDDRALMGLPLCFAPRWKYYSRFCFSVSLTFL